LPRSHFPGHCETEPLCCASITNIEAYISFAHQRYLVRFFTTSFANAVMCHHFTLLFCSAFGGRRQCALSTYKFLQTSPPPSPLPAFTYTIGLLLVLEEFIAPVHSPIVQTRGVTEVCACRHVVAMQ
jgi:hypothetical protein